MVNMDVIYVKKKGYCVRGRDVGRGIITLPFAHMKVCWSVREKLLRVVTSSKVSRGLPFWPFFQVSNYQVKLWWIICTCFRSVLVGRCWTCFSTVNTTIRNGI
eukprot:Pompholyxophrys_sp_v1_NODE_149_length_1514_cov_98.132968.p3 type:complete len:103 gc:universal NODE_149_length_1514_cov_98.132968:1078-1386(+)